MIRLSVMLLSSRGNHFSDTDHLWDTTFVRYKLCKLSYIEWEKFMDMRIGNRTYTCTDKWEIVGASVSSTVGATTY